VNVSILFLAAVNHSPSLAFPNNFHHRDAEFAEKHPGEFFNLCVLGASGELSDQVSAISITPSSARPSLKQPHRRIPAWSRLNIQRQSPP
jgi:hypothetical protein